ncbi:LPXTG cell wall anchor domain-containing protein [Actinoplanes sp. NBRC 101535]|uniref:LPXTG cell wall anchor domain-containing protein n=1 Tax=Actinoplanes sp. NBRC 101535 TaxID=3032196 RepID=UPI0024A109BB|nr:LPXTG cell wall anchor domain-containing protein [Actinoplanes sp. NBRC 101535]GLY04906.1 hypothetical protein Acsp01_52850 [Actinoplanes sp. NBRC 101535]
MNLSQSPLRRAAGLAAGAVLGLAGVAVVATPAFATDASIAKNAWCDTAQGDWVVEWTVTGNAPEGVNNFRFKSVDAAVGNGKPGGEKPVDFDGFKVTEDFTNPANTPITAQQRVKADKKYARLTVVTEFDNGHTVLPASDTAYFDGTCGKTPESPSPSPSQSDEPSPQPSVSESTSPEPSESTSTTASPTPSASETPDSPLPDSLPGEPEPIFEVTCTTMTIGFDNPEDSIAIKLHYKTSKGEERDLTIAPGEKKSETFSATEGFSIDLTIAVTYEGESFSETVTIPYEYDGECDGGSGGGLPVTGAAAGGIAAGAAGLLAVGGVLFFMARRRKVNFTA